MKRLLPLIAVALLATGCSAAEDPAATPTPTPTSDTSSTAATSVPTTADTPSSTEPASPQTSSIVRPSGFNGAPTGKPTELNKIVDYCMNDPQYEPGTTMFTDGTTGWTRECALQHPDSPEAPEVDAPQDYVGSQIQ